MTVHDTASVWPVRAVREVPEPVDEVGTRILRILVRWAAYANEQYAEWDVRPHAGHFFGGSYWYAGETIATALALAVASGFGRWSETATGLGRSAVRERIVAAIRYACFTHDTGPDDCVRAASDLVYVSEKKWGGADENHFMATQNGRSIALLACTALLIWDDLDDETCVLLQTVISSYADRWCDQEPRDGTYHDTQCEENAWTAAGIGAASILYPEHPRREAWESGFRRWARNAVTLPADRVRYPHGLIDDDASDSVQTTTFHPDCTAENHGFVHPAYMCAGINLRALPLVLAWMTRIEPALESTLNNERIYHEAIKQWTQTDGVVIPVQGQDWWYNRQHDSLVTHAVMSVCHGDSTAARFERNAVHVIEAIQDSNSRGCLLEEHGEQCVINPAHGQDARQLEHAAAADLAVAFLLHRFGSEAAAPADAEMIEAELGGVRVYPFGGIVTHRTRGSFTSFSYRNHVLGYAAPDTGVWAVTPHYLSYLGTISCSGIGHSAEEPAIREIDEVDLTTNADGFAVAARVSRCGRRVEQQVLFASLPDGRCVYAERIRARRDVTIDIATGFVGVRNESYRRLAHLAPGRRRLYYHDGLLEFAGFYGREPDRTEELPSCEWVNLDDLIGYRVYGSGGVRYLNRHVYEKWRGVEDQLVLNSREAVSLGTGGLLPPFAVVTTVGERATFTAAGRGSGRLLRSDDSAIGFEEHGTLLYARFAREPGRIEFRGPLTERVQLYPGRQRLSGSEWIWSSRAERFCAGFVPAVCSVEIDAVPEEVDLDAVVADDAVMLENRSPRGISLTVVHRDGRRETIAVNAGAFVAIETRGDAP
jgi:hypothetical protein